MWSYASTVDIKSIKSLESCRTPMAHVAPRAVCCKVGPRTFSFLHSWQTNQINHRPCKSQQFKAGVNPKAVFWLGIMFLMQISRLRFKQSSISMLISQIYVLGCFVNFLVIFRYIWREIVFLKGLVKLMEIGNFEDLLLF